MSASGFYSSSSVCFSDQSVLDEKVVLRPIKKPVAMAAVKDVKKPIPVFGQALGFDLVKLDWMPPHGEGEYQDALITAEGKWTSSENYWSTLKVEFVDRNCGVAKMPKRPDWPRSLMRSDYEAPFVGYQKSVDFEINRTEEPARTQYEHADVHYFRIRAKTPQTALYGKIYGDQLKMNRKGTYLVFQYYFLNPEAGSRNVEFDPEQNVAAEQMPHLDAKLFNVDLP